ncbi:MAG TPA: GntR family transcriptional regulator [Bacillota bacterium]|nr:GntR family transcriptional regulator [Bacillota bacterium]
MKLVVSESAEIPIYRQVYEQISGQILRGELPRDFVLPGIRTIAKELRISVITIKRAWEDLERDGFIYTLAGKGCFVAPLHAGELTGKREEIAADRIRKDLAYYHSLGLSEEEVIELVRKHFPEN